MLHPYPAVVTPSSLCSSRVNTPTRLMLSARVSFRAQTFITGGTMVCLLWTPCSGGMSRCQRSCRAKWPGEASSRAFVLCLPSARSLSAEPTLQTMVRSFTHQVVACTSLQEVPCERHGGASAQPLHLQSSWSALWLDEAILGSERPVAAPLQNLVCMLWRHPKPFIADLPTLFHLQSACGWKGLPLGRHLTSEPKLRH